MFSKEGPVMLRIGRIEFTEPKFPEDKGPNDFDIFIEVTNDANADEHDWTRLEWSANYGKGVMSQYQQREITMRTLKGIGFKGEDEDLSTLPEQLEGKVVPGFVKKTISQDGTKTYYNVYLGGGNRNAPSAEAILDKNGLLKRLKAMTAEPGAEPTQAAATKAPAKPRNPFAKTEPKDDLQF